MVTTPPRSLTQAPAALFRTVPAEHLGGGIARHDGLRCVCSTLQPDLVSIARLVVQEERSRIAGALAGLAQREPLFALKALDFGEEPRVMLLVSGELIIVVGLIGEPGGFVGVRHAHSLARHAGRLSDTNPRLRRGGPDTVLQHLSRAPTRQPIVRCVGVVTVGWRHH